MKKIYLVLSLVVLGGALYAWSRVQQVISCHECGSDHERERDERS
jgi:hypothetical protein